MSDLVFIQMSGAPGAGKTTLARAIAPQIGAVIIDHDITKSALLEATVPPSTAGAASYTVLDALARDLLRQGWSVIFDSPCLYGELLERGQRLAHEAGARYRYIECWLADLDALDHRLRTRSRLPSQLSGIRVPPAIGTGKTEINDAVFREWIDTMKRPTENYLVIDTTQPLESYITTALAYIRNDGTTSVAH